MNSFLIDYSCMSKFWYAAIINYLYLKRNKMRTIFVYFAYIPVSIVNQKTRI